MMMQISSATQAPLAAGALTGGMPHGRARVLKANSGADTLSQMVLQGAQTAKQCKADGLENAASKSNPELRKAFNTFVGQTFYGQMLQSMGKTVGKPAYVYGGRTEEVFREKLNDVRADKLSQSSADRFTGPMFELFSLQRR
jgi:hypothetical protein